MRERADHVRQNVHARHHRSPIGTSPRPARTPASASSCASRCPTTASWKSEGVPVYRGIGVRARAGPADGSRGSGSAGAAPTSSSTAPKGCGACTWSRCRAPARSMSSGISMRRSCLVVEGRGSTEVWQEGQTKKHVFEWQKGSLFAIPLNAFHRIVNASSSPALILCGTSAPNVMNLIDNPNFIFNCPHAFTERFSGADDFFKPNDDVEPDPIRGLAMRRTNFIPDIDQHRAAARQPPLARLPARRAVRWRATASMSGSASTRPAAIPRRTSTLRRRARLREGQGLHLHVAGGARHRSRGRTARPTRSCARTTSRSGIVSAAPMAGDWFHQHFGTSKEALRISAWHGPNNQRARKAGRPGRAAGRLSARSTSTRAAAPSPITRKIRRSASEFEATLARKASRAG